MSKKKPILTLDFDDLSDMYTAEQISNIDVDKLKSNIKSLIGLQLGGRVIKPINAILDSTEINGLAFPYFRLILSSQELGFFIKIRPRGDGMGTIFKRLKNSFVKSGLDSNEALKKADFVLKEFYKACFDLSSIDKEPPLSATIYYNNEKKNDRVQQN